MEKSIYNDFCRFCRLNFGADYSDAIIRFTEEGLLAMDKVKRFTVRNRYAEMRREGFKGTNAIHCIAVEYGMAHSTVLGFIYRGGMLCPDDEE